MSDDSANVELDFADGFIEGYLTGLMMGQNTDVCERDDCPR